MSLGHKRGEFIGTFFQSLVDFIHPVPPKGHETISVMMDMD